MSRSSKCGAPECDCGNHCNNHECRCTHTSCAYGWVDIGATTRPCGTCRPKMYADWQRALEQGISFTKYRQRSRGGPH